MQVQHFQTVNFSLRLLHNAVYVLSRRFGRLFSYNQPHMFHSFAVLAAGGNDIDSGCVDAAVAENIRQLGNVLFNAVKHPCEQMPQIMREYFLRIYPCLLAKTFHLPPDVGAADRPACSCNENCTRLYSLLRRIAEQFLLQFFHDKY